MQHAIGNVGQLGGGTFSFSSATFPHDLNAAGRLPVGGRSLCVGLGLPLVAAEVEDRLQGLRPPRAPLAGRLVGGRVPRIVAPSVSLFQVSQYELP